MINTCCRHVAEDSLPPTSLSSCLQLQLSQILTKLKMLGALGCLLRISRRILALARASNQLLAWPGSAPLRLTREPTNASKPWKQVMGRVKVAWEIGTS